MGRTEWARPIVNGRKPDCQRLTRRPRSRSPALHLLPEPIDRQRLFSLHARPESRGSAKRWPRATYRLESGLPIADDGFFTFSTEAKDRPLRKRRDRAFEGCGRQKCGSRIRPITPWQMSSKSRCSPRSASTFRRVSTCRSIIRRTYSMPRTTHASRALALLAESAGGMGTILFQ
jgi:hypothetical protein